MEEMSDILGRYHHAGAGLRGRDRKPPGGPRPTEERWVESETLQVSTTEEESGIPGTRN